MKVKSIIQRVQSLYSKGVQSDDSRLSPRHIYNKMLSVRLMLITQKANKKQSLNQWNYQVLPCIELIKVDRHECPCLPPVGCKFYRSKYKIPKPIYSIFGPLIQSVTTVDGSVIFSATTWEGIKYEVNNKYTGKSPKYFIKNQYLYILGGNKPKVVTIPGGIFEDPIEVDKFLSYCNEGCTDCQECESPLDKEFPIDGDLIEPLIEFCKSELIGEFVQMSQDKTNNSKDDNQSNPNE